VAQDEFVCSDTINIISTTTKCFEYNNKYV